LGRILQAFFPIFFHFLHFFCKSPLAIPILALFLGSAAPFAAAFCSFALKNRQNPLQQMPDELKMPF